MKLFKLKQSLENKCKENLSNKKNFNSINQKFKNNVKVFDVNNLMIIGITGSVGKTTTAIIVHEYLKMLGYKSILYSSAKIDSPASIKSSKESCEISFNTEEKILEIIKEAESYGADFLVLEVNESTIKKGLTKERIYRGKNYRTKTNEDRRVYPISIDANILLI